MPFPLAAGALALCLLPFSLAAAGDWPHVARDLYGPLADWLETGVQVAPLGGDASGEAA